MSAVLHRDFRQAPRRVVRGEGIALIDADGKRYLDASGGAAVPCLGHSHPAVVAAVQEQVARLAHAHPGFFSTERSEELAEAGAADGVEGDHVLPAPAYVVTSGEIVDRWARSLELVI